MKGLTTAIMAVVCGVLSKGWGAEPQTLLTWNWDEDGAKAWATHANCCRDVRIADGELKGLISSPDPFVTSPSFSLPATARQTVEFRAKVSIGGRGELFWVPVGTPGPQQKWSASFEWIGDGNWHDYRVRPFWQGENAIAAFRIDFPNNPANDSPFELTDIRIVDAGGAAYEGEPSWSGTALSTWSAADGGTVKEKKDGLIFRTSRLGNGALESPALKIDSDERFIAAVTMSASEGDSGCIAWASDGASGLQRKTFRIKPDGRVHTYNLDLGGEKGWRGNIGLLRLTPVIGKHADARVYAVRVSDDLQGPADVSAVQARLSDALNRAGRPAALFMQLTNCGGCDATNLTLSVRKLPKGVRVCSAPGWERVPPVPASATVTHTLEIESDRAVSGTVSFTLSGDGNDGTRVDAAIDILPDLNLQNADYVPVPHPVRSEYEIGALYFPGWPKIESWARIWPVAPERKPVLGWYDEGNPEVVDWQIKWAVENGLSYFLVDWYWCKGNQHLDHWVKAYQRARYRSYLKWAVMWANHNGKGSHSEADQRAVTKFWIENYFNMPEYYRIDDQPVVMIWSPQNMERDLGPGGCKRLLDLSRQMARDAGYKGIWFVAMKWPEASWDPQVVQGLKDKGFDMTAIYHYMGNGGKAENPRRFSFDLVADSNAALWEGLQKTGILPFLPNLSTGWDDRPWHGTKGTEIYGRTAKDFRRICRDAKAFADKTGMKRLCLGPLNEWGEGSYAEPCAQFGFGMYEAVRETFCSKPETGWPPNYGPKDVGLGPYDLPMPPTDVTSDWTFTTTAQGWSAMMGITDFKAAGGLTFRTASHDPALERMLPPFSAKTVKQIVVRMKLPAGVSGACQLFWSSGGTPTENTSLSLPLMTDGQMHDYAFDVAGSRAWRGRIGRLRVDPCNTSNLSVAVERIRLIPAEQN